jgi:mycothiol S-conjugate amidase
MAPVIQPALRVDAHGERLRLLHVHAHPDDESSKGAATTARYVAEGVEVMVATCTGGERGSILNPNMDRPDVLANIAEIRRQEMDAARHILGIEQVWLGFVDSGLPEGDPLPPLPPGSFGTLDPDEASIPLVEVIRRFRPHVLTTYDERGGYPHPDHIMCNRISVAAYDHAGDPAWRPELGPVWQTPKLYYSFGFHLEKTRAIDSAMTARGLKSPYAERLRDWKPDPEMENRVTTRVPCSDYFEVRDRALIAHATQIDPEGSWFQVPLDLQREVWPTEDYELVRTAVPTHLPEDDLFEGIAVAAERGGSVSTAGSPARA